VDAAYALLMADADRLQRMADGAEFTQLESARLRRDVSFVGQQCRRAVNGLFEAIGGSGAFEGNEMQRIFRDSNVAAAHGGLSWDTAGLLFGRLDAGLQPSAFDRSGRPIASLSGALT
jgi:alkylation response protein AidB-like acyl-CoA dehydrogenase